MIEKEKKKDRYQPCVVTIVAFDKADIVCTSQGVEKDAVNGNVDMWKNDFKEW